jgi:hypothetical protein
VGLKEAVTGGIEYMDLGEEGGGGGYLDQTEVKK